METSSVISDRRRNVLLWLGMLGPAIVWLVYLEFAYVLIHHAGKSGNLLPIHIVSATFLLLSVAGGIVAWLQWRSAQRKPTDPADEVCAARVRFMGEVGMFTAIEFSLLIGASWIAMFILTPFQS